MVDPHLLQSVREILEGSQRKFLVTGGTGFVGSHLARCLAESGHDVTVIGRNRYRTSRIEHPNIRFAQADIRNAQQVANSVQGHDIVFHVAALSAPWGKAALFRQVNVDGTRNIVNACREANIEKLVHVSSTAVFFDFTDLHGHRDDAAYASPQSCDYSDSKREAEQVVLQAATDGLAAYIIRARAVFGPGDTTLLPRLITAARIGKLRQIGNGQNLIDVTYIDNLVLALVQSAVRGGSGQVCTITDGKPVKLWEWLPEILAQLQIPFQSRPVSHAVAHRFAAVTELVHRAVPMLGEPTLTRYTTGLLAKHQVFSLAAAQSQLGYRPIVSTKEGVRRTLESLNTTQDAPSDQTATLRCFTTGYATGNRRMIERTWPNEETRFHALVGLIEHPTHGLTLFDTGYAPRLFDLRGVAARIYNRTLPTFTSDALSIVHQLRKIGIAASDIQRIIISHFHPDHVAGLRDFPKADFIASQAAWEAVRNRSGFSGLRRAYLPGLLPDDFERRLHLIETFGDAGIGPFQHCHDLFGDGSIRLLSLPGHADGQMGALVQTQDNSRDFLVADAAWTTSAIRSETLPHAIAKSFVHRFSDIEQTLSKLRQTQTDFPDIRLLPTHCPEVAAKFNFDSIVSE